MISTPKLFSTTPTTQTEKLLQTLNQIKSNQSHEQSLFIELNQKLKYLNTFDELQRFLQQLVSLELFPNIYILNQLMSKFFRLRQIPIALKVFQIIKNHDLQNNITYNTLISQLSKNGQIDFSYIQNLFHEAQSKNLIDTITYNSMLHGLAKLDVIDSQKALELFEQAKLENRANLVTYSSIIYVLAKSKPSSLVKATEIFEQAKTLFPILDEIIYANILLCIGNSECIQSTQIMKYFRECLSQKLMNSYITANTLYALSKSYQPDVELALEVLDIAKSHGFADKITYANTLAIIAKSKTPNTHLALEIFHEAKSQNLLDTVVYACVLDIFAHSANVDVEKAYAIFKQAKEQNMVNHISYASMIQIISKSNPPQLQLALDLFAEVKEKYHLDSHVFGNILHVIASCRPSNSQLAIDILHEAVMNNHIDVVCYANTLYAMANSQQPNQELSFKIYQNAKQQSLVNSIVATNTIVAINRSHKPKLDFIKSVYSDSQQHFQADKTFMLALLDSLTKIRPFPMSMMLQVLKDLQNSPHEEISSYFVTTLYLHYQQMLTCTQSIFMHFNKMNLSGLPSLALMLDKALQTENMMAHRLQY
jgi:hypothetical protein